MKTTDRNNVGLAGDDLDEPLLELVLEEEEVGNLVIGLGLLAMKLVSSVSSP